MDAYLADLLSEPMKGRKIDAAVLGCTHYPFLMAEMHEVIGERDVTLVNPAPAVARRVEWLLEQGDMRAPEGHKAEYSFVTFGGEEYLARIADKALLLAK